MDFPGTKATSPAGSHHCKFVPVLNEARTGELEWENGGKAPVNECTENFDVNSG